jgi:hypothetical protein
MANNPVGWFEIYVNDMARARQFYESVLGIQLQVLGDPSERSIEMRSFPADMERYGATGALVRVEGVAAGGNSTLVYFSCADCAAEESRIEPAGGRVHRPKTAIGEYGFVTLAVDTEGNMFGLHSLK